MPSGCNAVFNQSSVPQTFFRDISAQDENECMQRPVAFNSHCGRTDAEFVWGNVFQLNETAAEFACWMRMPSGCDRTLSETEFPQTYFRFVAANEAECFEGTPLFNDQCNRADAVSIWGTRPTDPTTLIPCGDNAESPSNSMMVSKCVCAAGYYNSVTKPDGLPSCVLCPVGSHCPGGGGNYVPIHKTLGANSVCDETFRITVACGGCGPQWGNLAKCKDLCDQHANCSYLTYFSDDGCIIFTECPTEGVWQNPWAPSSIYSRLSEPSCSTTGCSLVAAGAIAQGEWMNVVARYNSRTKIASIRINGTDAAETMFSGTFPDVTFSDAYVGRGPLDRGGYINADFQVLAVVDDFLDDRMALAVAEMTDTFGHCSFCPRGKYKNSVGSAACLGCPANRTSLPASTAEEQCRCKPGFQGQAVSRLKPTTTQVELTPGSTQINFDSVVGKSCILACEVIFPLDPAIGMIWHLGAGGNGNFGAWLGVSDSAKAPVLRARIGKGSVAIDSGTAYPDLAYVDIADFPTDNRSHQVVVEVAIYESRSLLRVWIDGQPKGFSSLNAPDWVGNGPGLASFGWVGNGSIELPSGEPNVAWSGGALALQGSLRLRIDTASYPPCFPSVLTGNWASDSNALGYLCEGGMGGYCSLQQPSLNSSRSNVVTRGGWLVTVSGLHFGYADWTLRSTVGHTACESTAWISNTALSIKTASGTGGTISTIISVISSLGLTGARLISYDKPSPWSLQVLSHQQGNTTVRQGNTTAKAHAEGLGPVDFSPGSRTGLTSTASTLWVSDSALTLRFYIAMGSSLRVALTVGNQVGSSTAMLSFETMPIGTTFVHCAYEHGECECHGAVRYGSSSRGEWSENLAVSGIVLCSNAVFGDPLPGVGKECQCGFIYYYAHSFNATANVKSTSGSTSVIVQQMALEGVSAQARIGGSALDTTLWVSDSSLCGRKSESTGTALRTTVTAGRTAGTSQAFYSTAAGIQPAFYSTDGPLVSSLGGASSEGTQVCCNYMSSTYPRHMQVSGHSFGFMHVSSRLRAATECEQTEWYSDSQISGTLSQGYGSSRRLVLTSGSQPGTLTDTLSYDTYSSVSSAINMPRLHANLSAIVGNLSIAVAGLSSEGSVFVRVGASSAESTVWISSTSLNLRSSSPSPVGTRAVTLTSGIRAATISAFVSFDVLFQISCTNSKANGSASVTVRGVSLGQASYSEKVRPGYTACGSTIWSSETSLRCSPVQGLGGSLKISVTVGRLTTSMSEVLSYDSAAMRVNNQGTFEGIDWREVRTDIGGMAHARHRHASLSSRSGHSAGENTEWLSSTHVVSRVASGVGTSQRVILTAGNQIGTVSEAMSYHEPVLQPNMSQCNVYYPSMSSIFLSGGKFGNSGMTGRLQAGSTSTETTSWISHSSMTGKYPFGYQGSLVITVTCGQSPGSHSEMFSYDMWSMSGTQAINTSRAQAINIAGGQLKDLYILSSNRLLSVGFSGGVRLGNSGCEFTEWRSETAVRVRVISGVTMRGSAGAIVTSALRCESISSMFSFDGAQQISALRSHNGAISALHTIKLVTSRGPPSAIPGFAEYFHKDFTFVARIGYSSCERTAWTSSSQIGCLVPKGAGSTLHVYLTGGSGIGTMSDFFSFDSPNQDVLLLDRNSPTLGMSTLTVAGMNFAVTDLTPGTRLGGGNSAATQTKWLSDTVITSKFPQGSRYTHGRLADGTTWCCSEPATVTVARRVATMSDAFSYDVQQVTGSTPANVPVNTRVNTILTFSGSSFLGNDMSLSARVGVTSAEVTQWRSDSSMGGHAAAGHGVDHNIVVTMVQTESSSLGLLTYDGPNPLYSNVTLPAWPTVNFIPGSSQVISILGEGMSRYDVSSSVRINTASQSSFWTSDSAMLCKLVGQSDKIMPVSVTVVGRTGTRSQLVSYDLHVIIDPFFKVKIDDTVLQFGVSNLRNHGAYDTVLYGSNFGAWSLTERATMGISSTEATQWITSSRIFCKFSAGVGQMHPVVLTIAAASTTRSAAVSFDRPVLVDSKFTVHFQGYSRASFSNIAAHESEPLQVGNFIYVPELVLVGNDLGDVDYSPKISVGISSCSATIWRSVTRVLCKAATGVSASYSAAVTAGANVVGSLTEVLTYNVPWHGPSETSNVAQKDENIMVFTLGGLTMSDCTSNLRLGSSASEFTAWKSDSSVLARVSVGRMRTARAVVSIGTKTSSCTASLTFDQLTVSSISTGNSPMVSGFHRTIQMSSFSVSRNAQFSSSGAVGGSTAEFSTWSSTSALLSKFPAGFGASAHIYVTSGLQVSSITESFSFDRATLLADSNTNLPIDSSRHYFIGADIKAATSPSLRLGSSSCQQSSWVSATAILCKHATTDARGSHGVVITAFAYMSTTSALVSFDSLLLSSSRIQNKKFEYYSHQTSIDKTLFNLPALGPTAVLLLGRVNFPRSCTPAARAFGTDAMSTVWSSATNVVTRIHSGSADKSHRPVTLSAGSRCSSITDMLSFDVPSLRSLAPKSMSHTRRSNTPAAHSQTLAASAISIGNWDYSMRARVGFSGASATFWASSTTLTLKQSLASMGREHLSVIASVGSTSGSISGAFSYDRHVLFAETTIANAPVLENRRIRISGAGFGIADSTAQIRIGATTCSESSWASDVEIYCRY